MRTYTSVWRIRFLNGLQYRTAAYAGIATQLFFGFIFIMIYVAFYNQAPEQSDLSLQQVVSYIWLQQICLSLVMLWIRDPEIFELITSGNIAYELCRPSSIYPFWYSKLLAQRVANMTLRCAPVTIIVLFLPEPYRLTIPTSLITFLAFLITLLLALLLVVAISMLIYISVFWTMSPTGSILLIAVLGEFLAGLVIPIPLMPQWMQLITYAFPFRWTVDFPFRVFNEHVQGTELIVGICNQVGWLVVMLGAGYWLMKKALRAVVIQGG